MVATAFRTFIAGNQQFQDDQPLLYQVMVTICYISILLNVNATFGSFLLLRDLGEVGYEAAKLCALRGLLEQFEVRGINPLLEHYGSNRMWTFMVIHCKCRKSDISFLFLTEEKHRDTHILLRHRDLDHGPPGIYHTDGVPRNHRPHDVCDRFHFRTYEPFYVLRRTHEAETQNTFFEFVNAGKYEYLGYFVIFLCLRCCKSRLSTYYGKLEQRTILCDFIIIMLISQKSRRLPIELYNEIIGFLWNDFPSLKACALASRVLLAPSQKRLFYSIGLNAYSGLSYGSSIRELMGRPSSFYWCLARSPHLADYVQALHICDEAHSRDLDVESTDVTPPVLGNEHDPHFDKDYKFTNGMEISDLDHAIQPPTNRRMVGGWLPRDKFLPLFAPLLSNLKALCIFYPFDWHCLTYKVLFTLLSLMQLPSLVHLRLLFNTYPQSIVSMAFGENIKHLALDSTQRDDNFPFQLEHPPLQPVYLESFLVCSPFVFLDHFPPTSRIQFSRLRKLAVVACSANDHPATQKLLRQCRDTLEDFEFNPSLWGK